MKRLFLFLLLFAGVSRGWADSIEFNTQALDAEPLVQICNAANSTVSRNSVQTDLWTLSPSPFEIQSTGVVVSDGELIGQIFTNAPDANDLRLKAVKIGEQIILNPSVANYEDGRLALLFRGANAKSLAILRGETLDSPLALQLKLEWTPVENQPGHVRFKVANSGNAPLSLVFGTIGTDDEPTRDAQMTFIATRDGKPVKGNDLLASGGLSLPQTLRPDGSIERLVDVGEYLSLSQAGHYQVQAHYTIWARPAVKSATPAGVAIGFDGTFEFDLAGAK